MKKYKVYYSGVCYVEAEDEITAEDIYDIDNIYEEQIIKKIEEVDDFEIYL